MSLEIRRDLSASVTSKYYDIRSGAETPAEQAVEMKRFYDKQHLTLANSIKDNWRLDTMEVTLSNKTDTGCDAELTGTTKDVISLLAAMEFNITREGNRYTMVHQPPEYDKRTEAQQPEPRPVFSLTFDGPVVEHNATRFDTGTWVMEWDSPRLRSADIRFVIDMQPAEPMTGEAAVPETTAGQQANYATGLTPEAAVPVSPTVQTPALFVDANLEQVVRAAAGKPHSALLVNDLISITYLDASGAAIRLLGGIEQLSSLRRLDLSGNQIRFIDPLSLLPELRELNLADNHINDSSGLAGASNLEVLNLARNHLRKVTPLVSLSKLRQLDLSDNHVGHDIKSLASLPNLRSLTMVNVHLVDARALSGFADLEKLDLSCTPVCTGLECLGELPGLRRLDLSFSGVKDIAFLARCRNLKYLNLSGIQVTAVDSLAGLTGLRELYLSHNRIADCRPLAGLTSLLRLDLSSNRIGDLTPLRKLTRLTVLDFSSNMIDDLNPLDRMHRLISLKLAGNRVSDITPVKHLVWLNFLDLSRNRVSDLKVLVDAPGIAMGDIILLDGNPLDQDDLPAVKSLIERRVRIRHTITLPAGFNE